MAFLVGDCFYFDPDGRNNDHFWVIIWHEQSGPHHRYILANASSSAQDRQCIMTHDDHRYFWDHDGYIRYEYLFDSDLIRLQRLIANNRFSALNPPRVSLETVRRIQRGAHNSLLTKDKFLKRLPNPPLLAQPPASPVSSTTTHDSSPT